MQESDCGSEFDPEEILAAGLVQPIAIDKVPTLVLPGASALRVLDESLQPVLAGRLRASFRAGQARSSDGAVR